MAMTTAVGSNWSDADLALLQDVYELKCISRMNALYYERRLGHVQQWSFIMEVLIALTATGSGVAAIATGSSSSPSLTLFGVNIGQWTWHVLALTAAIVAVVRPIYAPGRKIETFTRQQQGYHANFFALKKLGSAIRQEGGVSADHRRRYDTFFDRHVQLSTEDETAPDRKCLDEARRLAGEELPPGRFWWPSGQTRMDQQDQAGGVSSSGNAASAGSGGNDGTMAEPALTKLNQTAAPKPNKAEGASVMSIVSERRAPETT